MHSIKHIQHTQFVENVLGIKLSPDQSCLLMEGVMPSTLKERIQYETQLYENFLDSLAKKIGAIPTNIQKTFTSAMDVLKFIYNVIADKTGENIKKAIAVLSRNARSLFSKIGRAVQNVPEELKEIVQRILDWLQSKVGSIMAIKSDVDDKDNVKGDGGNWKKFILLLLAGSVLVAVYKLGDIVKDFGADAAKSGLEQMLSGTTETLKKLLSEPQTAIASTGGAAITTILLPLLKVYAGAKILQTISNQLLDSNAWLKKT